MTQNEESAQALKLWLGDLAAMKAKTEAHLMMLAKLNEASSQAWIDEAIEVADSSIRQLERDMEFTRRLIGLAENDQLHNPSRG